MALRVDERAASNFAGPLIARFEALTPLLRPRPGRLEFAARLALICALTTLMVQIYQTPDAALTVYVAFFLNKPDRVESVMLSVVLTLLITVVVGLILFIAMLVVDEPMWRVAVMTAFSFGFLFIAFASKLRPLAGTITLIVAYALDLLGTVHSGEFATRALLYAWLFVSIPAGVSLVVNLLLAPAPRQLIERTIAERLSLAAALLRDTSSHRRDALAESQREGLEEIPSWLKLATLERTSPIQDIAALRQAAQSTVAILSWVDVVAREPRQLLPEPLRAQVVNTFENMARIFRDGGYPVQITLEDSTPRDTAPAGSGGASDQGLSPRGRQLWTDLQQILGYFAEPSPEDPAPSRAAAPSSGFLQVDAFTNSEYVHYALKTTAAAMFCYLLYSLLDWSTIHTCFITCYIVSLGTAAETIEKLTLRILGCLIGAAAGIAAIVYAIPSLTSIAALLAVVFLGALAAAWVAGGSPRIAYAGFQIAFAFFLCVIQGPSPAFDLVTARDRIIGILLGNLVVYVLFTRVWPVSVGNRIDESIVNALRQLSVMARATTAATRNSVAAHVQGLLAEIEQNTDLAQYEPRWIRPSSGWLEARRQAVAQIGALQAPLLFSAGREPLFAGSVARSLDSLADTVEGAPAPSVWAQTIDPHLDALRAALRRLPVDDTASGTASHVRA